LKKSREGKPLTNTTGRPPQISPDEAKELLADVEQGVRSRQSLSVEDVAQFMMKKAQERAELQGRNKHAIQINMRAAHDFVKNKLMKVSAYKQNERRREANADWRNHVAAIVIMRRVLLNNPCDIQSLQIQPNRFFNMDGVSILLTSDGATFESVVTTPKMKNEMKSQHQSTKTTGKDNSQYFRLQLFLTTNAAGATIAPVWVIKDQDGCRGKIRYFKLPGLNNGGHVSSAGYVYLIPRNFDQNDMMEYMLSRHILPDVYKSTLPPVSSPNSTRTYSQHSESDDSDDDDDDENIDKRIVFSVDGDAKQMKALMTKKMLNYMHHKFIWCIKWSAACSSTQQPNDTARTHPNLKRMFKNLASHKYNTHEIPRPAYDMNDLEKWLRKYGSLNRQKLPLVLELFQHAADVFSNVVSPRVVKAGYRVAGWFPFCADTVLAQCSEWQSLPSDMGTAILNGIELLVDTFSGRVTEADMDSVGIPESPQYLQDEFRAILADKITKGKHKPKTSLNELVMNRQRAMITNAEDVVDLFMKRIKAKAKVEADKVEAKQLQEQAKVKKLQDKANRAAEKKQTAIDKAAAKEVAELAKAGKQAAAAAKAKAKKATAQQKQQQQLAKTLAKQKDSVTPKSKSKAKTTVRKVKPKSGIKRKHHPTVDKATKLQWLKAVPFCHNVEQCRTSRYSLCHQDDKAEWTPCITCKVMFCHTCSLSGVSDSHLQQHQ
jgi:hypothetical protein